MSDHFIKKSSYENFVNQMLKDSNELREQINQRHINLEDDINESRFTVTTILAEDNITVRNNKFKILMKDLNELKISHFKDTKADVNYMSIILSSIIIIIGCFGCFLLYDMREKCFNS